ncbi:hypothetical protein Ae263Ps1_5176c [Pseudonocardia sp. Ae263_Ps1]|nr:hypothetical protein Ae150APs1_0166 [Pseudonocardia sp. Ae150A_Ps1]OLL88121.1 hypothetical protein Ae263Ps1_5176c [Pseudonocardia sp. Ae263_Ps1]OLL91853.1 hypothetical protein Ae356Ps1_1750 [Pseudonocardia sp. Ae356_Ps1]
MPVARGGRLRLATITGVTYRARHVTPGRVTSTATGGGE